MDDWVSEHKHYYNQYSNMPVGGQHWKDHRGESQKLLCLAAFYVAGKAYKNKCAADGKPESYAQAQELLVKFGEEFIDDEVRTKRLLLNKAYVIPQIVAIVEHSFTEDVYNEN